MSKMSTTKKAFILRVLLTKNKNIQIVREAHNCEGHGVEGQQEQRGQ